MKLENLTVIFIIIIIPIILIFSYYLGLEADTIRMQTDYDEKLIEATKEAVEAFEINTVEWNNEYSSLANNKRRNLTASINVFTTSLASKLGIGGTAKENILNYVPVIIFTMYDGYYIYSPTYVPQALTDENGLQLYYYNHSEFDEYITTKATQIKTNTSETIAGEPMYVPKSNAKTGNYNGQTITFTTNINDAETTYKHVLKTFVPYTSQEEYNEKDYVINYTLDNYVRVYGKDESREGYILKNYSYIFDENNFLDKVNNIDIDPENLAENVAIRNSKEEEIQVENYTYIYNSNNEKRYYDTDSGKFFSIDNYYVKNYDLPDEYKKVSILQSGGTEYLELYQKLNGGDMTWYYKTAENEYVAYSYQPVINKNQDCSAINYYVENYCFNKWLESKEIAIDVTNKNDKIIENINTNLNLAISNYSANSKINYTIPELSPTDWNQALSNISMITFFQGVKIGLKTYNNYAIVTSTENNEYVAEDSLYMVQDQDEYYHRVGCSKCDQPTEIFRNTEFKVQSYTDNETQKYYYKHRDEERGTGKLECFECIVNRNNMQYIELGNTANGFYLSALARERYIQMSRASLFKEYDYISINNSPGNIEEPEPVEPETPEPNPEPCSHTNYTYISNGTSGHKKVCSECNLELGTESHDLYYYSYSEGKLLNLKYYHKLKCRLCSYEGNAEQCQISSTWSYDDKNHWKTCEICKKKLNTGIHSYINNICRNCGYKKNSM